MARLDGTAALKLDLDGVTATSAPLRARGSLRLAARPGVLQGPDKYNVLAHRRRQAQIKARRLLDLMEEVR